MASFSFPPGWTVSPDGRKVGIEVRTEDFVSAIRLFQRIAEAAEALEHHPDLHLEQYDRVRIESWSHDAGGLTSRDERLAQTIHALLRDEGLASR